MRNTAATIALFAALSCGGSTNNDPATSSNNTSNATTTANNTQSSGFTEIAFRVTNDRDMPVFIPGRPFVIYHGADLVGVAWGGCGCGNKCGQDFGPSFALASGVTAAEVWYGTLLDTAVCNLANDLVGETLEVEVCSAATVDDAMELVDPACERKSFVPGTDDEVVFTIE